jgi:GT2 family glycosyltransferase
MRKLLANGRRITARRGEEHTDRIGVSHVSWLAADVLLIVGYFKVRDAASPGVHLTAGSDTTEADTQCLWLENPDDHGVARGAITAHLAMAPSESEVTVMILSDGTDLIWQGDRLNSSIVDLRTLVREDLAALPREARESVLDFVISASAESGSTQDRLALCRSLFTLRDALRESYPRSTVLRDEPRGLHIDTIIALDERSFFVCGWIRDEQASAVRLTAIAPEGLHVSLLDKLFRVRRPDVEQFFRPFDRQKRLGFACQFSLEVPSYLPEGWIFEMEDSTGVVTEAEAPPVVRDPVAGRDTVVAQLWTEPGPDTPLMEHAIPAVTRLQERLAEGCYVEEVEAFGDIPTSPEVSIVVPLYRRIDLLEQQLAEFAGDPELAAVDLVYVLDSPELADSLMSNYAPHLFELYGIPFRIAKLSCNGGFAVANNRGASLAGGRLLLLLNSDVFPISPQWLGRLTSFYDSKHNIGALGPKLLFEDGTLQHAGLYFVRPAQRGPWYNAHYFKGLHGDLEAANLARPVPAVTGACLMVDLELYRDVGGLSVSYIQGDHEDSHLCLQLREAGLENWYLPDVALYHLEAQSYPGSVRQGTSRFNSWCQTYLWGNQIRELMREAPFAAGAASVPTP